jgi:cell division protein FtsN
LVSEQDAKKFPTRNIFEDAEPLLAEEDTSKESAALEKLEERQSPIQIASVQPSKLLTAPGRYFVQAGTFGLEDNARKLVNRIETDYNAKIVRLMSGDKPFYRVMIGPYAEAAHAKGTVRQLNSIGVADARIIRN